MCNRIYYQKGAGDLFDQILASQTALVGKYGLCGGRGACGKCIVRFLAEAPLPSFADRKFLTPLQLREGYRLACTAKPYADCEIEICFLEEEEAEIITHFGVTEGTGQVSRHNEGMEQKKGGKSDEEGGKHRLFCAIDLGTTTCVMQLADSITGDIIYTYAFQNPQRAYGIDVLSRIYAAENGKAKLLQEVLIEELEKGFQEMKQMGQPEKVIVSGNTAMSHILLGYPAESLGKAPFTPYHIGRTDFELCGYPAVFMPGISAFVGADIVSGIYACGMAEKEEHTLFIDLGTNGEMAAGNRDRILCTAAAAGSAFEGNVSSQMMGTDITAIAFDMLTSGVMDETGLMQEPWFTEGYRVGKVLIRQQDIRSLQTAKAAICAGARILLERMDLWDKITDVYLAGGFGYYLDVDKAVGIGLIPEILQCKCRAVGNTSLAGAVRYGRAPANIFTGGAGLSTTGAGSSGSVSAALEDSTEDKKLQHIVRISQSLNLAEQPEFTAYYIEAMAFRKM